MTESQSILLGSAIVALLGLITWLVQGNFNDLKRGQKDLRNFLDENMVGRAMCAERHKSLEKEQKDIKNVVSDHARHIRHVFKLIGGTVLVEGSVENEEREED